MNNGHNMTEPHPNIDEKHFQASVVSWKKQKVKK